jgi:hypothetical protein
MPRKNGRRLHDDQCASPSCPHAREPDPEDAVRARESRSRTTRPFEDVDLLSQGEHFELQCNARSKRVSAEPSAMTIEIISAQRTRRWSQLVLHERIRSFQ